MRGLRELGFGLVLVATTGCNLQPSTEHVMQADFPNGVPVVPVRINGITTLCVLDTGDTAVWLSPTFGGEPANQFTEGVNVPVQELVFAGWNFSGFEALTAPEGTFTDLEATIGAPGSGVECILGNAILGAVVFTVDWSGGWIEAAEVGGRRTRPSNTTDELITMNLLEGEVLYVGDADIDDDLRGIMLVSTAQPRTVLRPTAFDDLDDPPESTDQGGGVLHTTLSTVTIEDFTVTQVPAEVRDVPYLDAVASYISLPVDGIVGTSVLAGGAVTFDLPNQTLEIRPYEDDVAAELLSQVRAGM